MNSFIFVSVAPRYVSFGTFSHNLSQLTHTDTQNRKGIGVSEWKSLDFQNYRQVHTVKSKRSL